MKLQIEKLPDEPIILMTISGNLDSVPPPESVEQLHSAFADSPELDFLIIDIRGVPESFDNLLHMLRLIQNETFPADARELARPPLFVGSNNLVDTFIRKALPKYFGATHTPVFRVLDDALRYVREQPKTPARDNSETP